MAKKNHSTLSAEETNKLLATLEKRFNQNPKRHPGLTWELVLNKLKASPEKLVILQTMEDTGGEPDVFVFDKKSTDIIFMDAVEESPKGRRSICYDQEGLDSRKEFKPKHNAIDMATEMGINMLNEEEYRKFQSVNPCDLKTSSWLLTPPNIRKLGGAIFGDQRYGHVFIYHNGAQSYYGSRGFRGYVKI